MSIDVVLKNRGGEDITYDAENGIVLRTPQNTTRKFYPGSDDPGYITFSSPGAFTLQMNDLSGNKAWNGVLEYSSDATTWTEIAPKTWPTIYSGSDNKIYLRGFNNSTLGGDYQYDNSERLFILIGTDISVSGNMATLLDANSVKRGVLPPLGMYAFAHLFQGNANLINADVILPHTRLAYSCYYGMFNGTGITRAPALPATQLDAKCYHGMFMNCSNLAQAPELPATTLADSCYHSMFYGCAFEYPPELPALTLASSCYSSMFSQCTRLVEAPELPATVAAGLCYSGMFSNTGLTTPPEIKLTQLAYSCCSSMFYRCASLSSLAKIYATSISDSALSGMYSNCTSIKVSSTRTGIYQYPFRIPVTGTGTVGSGSLSNMFASTGGTFTGTPSVNTTYYTDHEPV